MSDDNGKRFGLAEEDVLEEAVRKNYENRPKIDRVRMLLDVYAQLKQEELSERIGVIAPDLQRAVTEYLALNLPVEDLRERCQALLPELAALVPVTSPSPVPAPRPATRAEPSRIIPPTPPQPPPPAEVICAGYILMPQTSTYALSVQALRQACEREGNADPRHRFVRPDGSWIYRPLTFKETIQARVESYERSALEERLKLFDKWEDSCTGAAYQARTTKFKLIPQCQQLITIPADFNGAFLDVPYNTWDVPELDSAAPGAKFNQQLTPNEVEVNEGWRTGTENDLPLLRAYRDIVWDAYTQRYNQGNRPDKLMGFYVRQNMPTDELRALFVHNLNDYSDAGGRNDLYNNGSFLRVAHR